MNRMDELLERAFQLAHFIHRDEEAAKCIALAAAEKLEAVMAAQDKRRYYLPSRKSRNKVSLSELATLQRLVYAESECYERQREQSGHSSTLRPRQETMIVHFVKHLVRITVRQNSIYVAVGISRLLHDYKTSDAAELCAVVRQSPDRIPDDDYLRALKSKLMGELKQRFGRMLGVTRGLRGEERFQAHEDSSRFVALIHECLRQFTPWGTQCVVPEKFDAQSDGLPALDFDGNDPDEEHPVEANRFHATLDPLCFDRVMAGIKREAPVKRLAVPVFQFGEDGSDQSDSSAGAGNSLPELSAEDRQQMSQHLENQSGRRKASAAGRLRGTLRVLVDGEERARLDAQQNGQTRFTIGESAELVEVWASDQQGEFLLAAHMLVYETSGDALKSQQVEFAPASGQRLAFHIAPLSKPEGVVEIRYYAPTASALGQIKTWFWPSGGGWRWLKPALTYALLLVAAGLLINRLARKDGGGEIVVVVPSPSSTAIITPTPVDRPSPLPTLSPPSDDVSVKYLASRSASDENLTRSQREENAVTSLLAAKKLFIDAKGSSVAAQFGESLRRRLEQEPNVKFVFTDKTDKPDIALKLTVEPFGKRLRVIASIINADGDVFWPLMPDVRARQYTGAEEKILEKLSRELLSDIQRLEQKQK